MKIAFVVTRSDAVGGAQVHVRDVALALRSRGHEPVILVGGDGPWLEDLRRVNLTVVRLKHLARSISPLGDLSAFFELRSVLRQLNPQLVSTHTAKAGWLGRIAARSLRLPVLFTAHGWTFTEGVAGLASFVWRYAERAVGRLAGRIITVSRFDRALAIGARIAPPERLIAIHNGMPDIPPSQFADPVRSPPNLIMVARFEDQKDHRSLLIALSQLLDREWTLSLIGSGPTEQSMKDLSVDLKLNDRIRFLGQRNDVPSHLHDAQIFVLSTYWEGLPRSIIEAMRAGLPVVASTVAGIPELVDDGASGLLCRPGDPESLRGALQTLLDSPALRVEMGAVARQRYLRLFQFNTMLARTMAVYEEMAAPDPASSDSRTVNQTLNCDAIPRNRTP